MDMCYLCLFLHFLLITSLFSFGRPPVTFLVSVALGAVEYVGPCPRPRTELSSEVHWSSQNQPRVFSWNCEGRMRHEGNRSWEETERVLFQSVYSWALHFFLWVVFLVIATECLTNLISRPNFCFFLSLSRLENLFRALWEETLVESCGRNISTCLSLSKSKQVGMAWGRKPGMSWWVLRSHIWWGERDRMPGA